MAARPELAPLPFVGESPEILEVKRLVERVGPSNASVLILGETGTGKEVIAHALYASNPAGRFVTVDCSALVGPLIESELFGHVRGAFTGALTPKQGLLETAHGGTAFFDEIGELPLEMQVKLLRVLQDKELRPVGSTQSKRVEFRVIAATNRDLNREVRKGNFREDLYYRLNVVKIQLPPLRQRQGDIPILVDHFLSRFGPHLMPSVETMEALLQYPWPGNVRELKNCLERMAVMNTGPYLHTGDLPTTVRTDVHRRRNGDTASPVETAEPDAAAARVCELPTGLPFPKELPTLAELERWAILKSLDVTKGDKLMAARLLGVSRTTLYRRLKDYGLV